MKSKTLFFSQTIIKEDLKRFWGLGFLYFIIMFLSGPLMFLLHLSELHETNGRYYYDTMDSFIRMNSEYEILLLLFITVPIIMAAFLFRYLQTKNATNTIHAMPFTRFQLLNSHIISSLILMIVPLLLITFTMILIRLDITEIPETFIWFYSVSSVWKWFFQALIINLFVFSIAVFSALISGLSAVQFILSYIFIGLPYGLFILIHATLSNLVYGFNIDYFHLEEFMFNLLPISAFPTNNRYTDHLEPYWYVWYFILIVIFYVISTYLYKKRDMEKLGDIIVFKWTKEIIKYGFTFCITLISCLYFYELMGSINGLYLGVFIGSFVGYLLAEMILRKSIWIFKYLKGYVVYAGIIFLILLSINFDLLGYEKHIPEFENIVGVSFQSPSRLYYSGKNSIDILKEKENIESFRHFHDYIIQNKNQIKYERIDNSRERLSLIYELTNGKTLTRTYLIPSEIDYFTTDYKKVYTSKENRILQNKELFNTTYNNIDMLQVTSDDFGTQKKINITDQLQIKTILASLKDEYTNESFENMLDLGRNHSTADIQIYLDPTKEQAESGKIPTIYVEFKSNFKNLRTYFESDPQLDDIVVSPKDIDSIIVEEKTTEDEDYIMQNEPISQINKNIKRMTIIDPTHIQEILLTYDDSPHNKDFIVGFYKNNEYLHTAWYSKEDAPDFISSFFK